MKKLSHNIKKQVLFERLLATNAFWSYDRNKLTVESIDNDLLIENAFIHGDVDELVLLLQVFTKETLLNVWHEKIISDERLYKLNYYIGVCFFQIPDVKNYIKKHGFQNSRYEKLKQFAEQY